MLGERRANQAQLALVLIGISAMSSLALFLYPLLGHMLDLSDRQAGFMIGASIHDVAQALGAGYAFSPEAGETAAIVKLTRVALLAPALAAVAWFFPRDGAKGAGAGIPWFVVGFFLMAGVNSTGFVPAVVTDGAAIGASALLAWAVTATGMRSPMNTLLGHGMRPFAVILASTLVALLLSLGAAFLLGK